MDPKSYLDKLQAALDEVAAAKARFTDALTALDGAAAMLLRHYTAADMDAYHGGDVLAADQHLDSIKSRLAVLQAEVRGARKEGLALDKLTVKVDYGVAKVYADIRERAEQERDRLENAQQELPGTGGGRRGRRGRKDPN